MRWCELQDAYNEYEDQYTDDLGQRSHNAEPKPKLKLLKRPNYCKKRQAVRKSMNLRSNRRQIRW